MTSDGRGLWVWVADRDDSLAQPLSEAVATPERPFDIEPVQHDRWAGGDVSGGPDCLVLDARVVTGKAISVDLVASLERRTCVVLVLGDESAQQVDPDVVAAVSATLPRSLVTAQPAAAVERLSSVVETGGRTQLDDGAEAVSVHDPWNEQLVDVNETFCTQMGYERDTLLDSGRDVPGTETQTGEDLYDRQRTVSASGEPTTVEWWVETAAGERRLLEARLTPTTVGKGDRVRASTRDVTDRYRREQAVEEEREKYSTLVEQSSDGVVVVQNEEYVFVNDRFVELTGYERSALVGREFGEIFTPDSRELVRERYHRRVAGESPPNRYEVEIETADGTVRRLDLVVSEITHKGVAATQANFRDVTEQRELERTYRALFENVSDGLVVHDPDTGEVLDVNDRYCELMGYERDQLLGETLDLVTPPGYSESRAQDRILAARENGPQLFEWRGQRASGEQFPVEVHLNTVDIRGEEQVLGSVRDITERERSERRLRAILDRIDEAIFLTRADQLTDPSESPEYVSAGYEAIWGEPLADIVQRYDEGFFGSIHPDEDLTEYREFVESISQDIEAGTAADSYAHEYRIQRPDGTLRWVRSEFYPTAWDGQPMRIVIVSRDVTDRKRRERRMTSFTEATDELTTADSPAEATCLAVEAAIETLDLSAVGAFLYDDADGRLRPESVAGVLSETVDPPTAGIGDGPLWEGFATETVLDPEQADRGLEDLLSPVNTGSADGEPADNEGTAVLDDWRVMPLSNHGVLLIGSPGESLDAETVQSAHVLAATLEAALNHLRGEHRLERQEAALRTQTQRADRLERIARLTQQVEAAITDASDPAAVERAVCERLAGTGPYEAAWISGVDVGADDLTSRVVVGTSRQFVDELSLPTTDQRPDAQPTVAAWHSNETTVAPSLVEGTPPARWRQHFLAEGFQSLCAIPLRYDGITHGVLTVAATTPHAFEDREYDVLDQLGTSVGYALAAIERRRALESDETVELEFRGTDVGLRFARAAREAGRRVHHERTVARDGGEVSLYFRFEDDATTVPDSALEVLPGTVDVVTDGSEADAVLVEARTDEWFGSPLAEYGAVLREATASPTETTVVVEVTTGADVRAVTERLQELAPALGLAAKRQHTQRERTPSELRSQVEDQLTDRQFEVLSTAFTAGYFEWPREHDGSEVAERLGITQPTFNKHLRLGERKTLALLFGEQE